MTSEDIRRIVPYIGAGVIAQIAVLWITFAEPFDRTTTLMVGAAFLVVVLVCAIQVARIWLAVMRRPPG